MSFYTQPPEPVTKPQQKKGGFGYGVATLMLLGFVSWTAQFVAASAFGIAEYIDWSPRSTGGAVAVFAAILMWWKCRSWETWRRWIWVPIGIMVILAFVVMGGLRQTIEREDSLFQPGQTPQQTQVLTPEEEAEQAEANAACDDLWTRMQAAAREIEDRKQATSADLPSWSDGERPSWASEGKDDVVWGRDVAAQAELDRMIAAYDANC